MLGLHAFALEEAQRIPEAFATAEVAVARNPARRVVRARPGSHPLRDGCVAGGHVAAAAGHSSLYAPWLVSQSPGLAPGPHALRHRRLRQGQHDGPGGLRAASLVGCGKPARLYLAPLAAGAMRGQRWRALAALRGHCPRSTGSSGPALPRGSSGNGPCRGRRVGDRRAATRHAPRAGAQRTARGWSARSSIPLVEGLHAFAAGDYRCVIERLEPLRSRIVELGGSRAQRDVFHDTLLEACFRAGDAGRAWRWLAERVARRADAYWLTRKERSWGV